VELDNMAIIKKKIENLKPGKEYVLTVRAKNSDLNVLSDYSDTIRFQVPNDTTTPSALTNLQLFAGLENVMFVFDYSQDLDVRRYEYELYQNSNMSDEGGPLTGFADANVFTVRVSNLQLEEDGGGLAPFWGRARTIDTTGNVGPWTSLVQTDPHTPLIDNQYIGSLTASKITAGTIGSHTINLNGINSIIQSTTYLDTSGTQGWQIRGDGHFSLGGPNGITYDNDSITIGSDVSVTATLSADSITVGTAPNQLKINGAINSGNGGMTIGDPTNNYWYSNGQFRTGNATNYVLWNGTSLSIRGTLQFADGTTPGTFDNGDAITGGSVAGLTISSTKMYIGTGTFNNANTAFYVDNAGQFSLKDKLSWNGNTLTINGGGTFTGALSAATGTFQGALSGGTISIGTDNSIFKADSNGIYLGNSTFLSAPFRVTPAGVITATSGVLGGWNIGTVNQNDSGALSGALYSGSGPSLSAIAPGGWAWFSQRIITPLISGYGSGTSSSGGGLQAMFIRNIQYGGTKPGSPAVGDIYFS